MARFVQLTAALGFLLEIPSSAAACPFCDSSTAEQVRAGIFNSDFGYHLGVALAPFPILIHQNRMVWKSRLVPRTSTLAILLESPRHF